ncbi:methyl-accepting chemotaxis protein [Aurantimonas sp. VKM B-3413]|uniref:methyl-accepting chemotaxis protein n=1 Tax=Aurantimonas sp. VKM B-3413 TaxID=2779401 RepID=UPI001E3B58A1|nr:methyl-accepting chemotaxis protein [Aurantimonas sp. VKM B-3413]MCB8840072.1 methyl-accepting chemotaxis protein [Aurantimonas sp. VKM B-3413]
MSLRSLSSKLLLLAGGTVGIIVLGAVGYSAWQTKNEAESRVYEQAKDEARDVAGQIGAQIGQAAAAGKTMSGIIAAGHEAGERSRQAVIAMLKSVALRNDTVFGAWMAEAKGAYDGFSMRGAPGANEDGIFTPYWTKTQSGDVTFSTFNADYDAPWYKMAASTGQGAVTEPYMASEVKVLMASAAFPVVAGSKTIGVAGVDFSLGRLSAMLGGLSPFDGGRVMLVSGSGNWLVNPDVGLLTKPYDGEGAEAVTKALEGGEAGIIPGVADGAYERIVYPFVLPELNATWAVLVDVPRATFTAPVEAAVLKLLVGGGIVLAGVLIVLMASVRGVVTRPLGRLLASVETLKRGDYDAEVEGREQTDEIGTLAQALEGFRHQLKSGVAAELAADVERQKANRAREEGEAERQAAAAEQARIVAAVGAGLARLAHGDLAHSLDGRFEGPYRRLKEDYDAAVTQLRTTIAAVAGSVTSIESGTQEISQATDNMTRRIESQAASVEEAAAALDDITSRVSQSAGLAEAAATVVGAARGDAETTDEVVHQAIEAMQGIATSSRQIETIIGVIDEIAFQTNLLALNAGVEAARAGEAGKGFAVVAQEVRELAQRSASAAREIKSLIASASGQVDLGVEHVGKAGEALQRIAGQVLEIDGKVRAIAEGARDQASGLKEINGAVGQMDQVTQQNAAMIEEANAATQALRGEAAELERLVARFEVGVDGARRPGPRLVRAA